MAESQVGAGGSRDKQPGTPPMIHTDICVLALHKSPGPIPQMRKLSLRVVLGLRQCHTVSDPAGTGAHVFHDDDDDVGPASSSQVGTIQSTSPLRSPPPPQVLEPQFTA